MRAYVFAVGMVGENAVVTLKEKRVVPGGREARRSKLGENVQKAVDAFVSATAAPRWFAENIVRWRMRHGMVLQAVRR